MRKWVAVTLLLSSLAACAKKQPMGEVDLSPKVTVTVVNNFTPPDQVQVSMVNAAGGRQVLGTVSPGRTVRFQYQPTSATDKFVLTAQFTSGRTMTSQQFNLVNADAMTWDLRSNTMQLFEP